MRKLNKLSIKDGVRVCVAVYLLFLLGYTSAAKAQCTAVEGIVSGQVYQDLDDNGLRDAGDKPISNVLVTAYDASGSRVASTATGGDGQYEFKDLVDGSQLRIQFTYPSRFTESSLGEGNRSSVQFASVPSCNASLGLSEASVGCLDQPDLFLSCFVQGETSTNAQMATLISLSADFNPSTPVAKIATHAETGSVWGVAYRASTDDIYSAAFVKQYSGLAASASTIFRTSLVNGEYQTRPFIDLRDLGVKVADLEVKDVENCAYGNQVGKFGLGAMVLSGNEQYLYVANLSGKEIVRVSIDNPTEQTTRIYPVPSPGCGSYEVFALEMHGGRLYVGATCTAEGLTGSDQDKESVSAAVVYEMSLADGNMTEIFRTSYIKGHWHNNGASSTATMHWLTDIDFTDEGNMLISLSDRVGHRFCDNNTGGVLHSQNPDLLIAYQNEQGLWTLESNGLVGELVGSGVGNGQGPDGGEFFGLDHWPEKPLVHTEVALGSVLTIPGTSRVIAAVYDPMVNSYSGGLHIYDTRDGGKINAIELYSHTIDPLFGKATGFGAITTSCGQTMVQIGNYVWDDVDNDGIQDADEAPLAGVELELYDSSCTLVGETTTDDIGYYTFNASNVDNNGDGIMDGVTAGGSYYISISKSQFQSDIEFVQLGQTDYIFTTKGGDSQLDNNASVVSDVCDSDILIELTAPVAGNDYSLDIGLTSSLIFDLALRKDLVGSPNTVYGQNVPFEIEVYHHGNYPAKNIVVSDYIPSGMTFNDSNNTGWTADGANISYTITDILYPNTSIIIPIVLTLDGNGTDYINAAELSDAQDLNGGHPNDIDSKFDNEQNNDTPGIANTGRIAFEGDIDEDDYDTAVVQVFDLALMYELAGDPRQMEGNTVEFVATVFNQGTTTADEYDIVVYKAEGLSFASTGNEDWTVENDVYVHRCTRALKPGQHREISVFMTIDRGLDASSLSQWSEIARATDRRGDAIDFDSTPDRQRNNDKGGVPESLTDDIVSDHGLIDEDDQDPATLFLQHVDIALIKMARETITDIGSEVVFDITLFNQGSVPIYEVGVVDYLPIGLELADDRWELVSPDKAVRSIEIPSGLKQNESTTIEIRTLVTAEATSIMVNEAEVMEIIGENDNDISDLDIDSDADDIQGNDMGGRVGDQTDNLVTGDRLVDEDDEDPAFVALRSIGLDTPVCLNNASNAQDGQYRVTVSHTALSGQSWYIKSINNLWSTASGAPPAPPAPFMTGPAGDTLVEYPMMNVGMSDYRLPAIFVEGIDYSITISNGNPADDQEITGTGLTYNDITVTGPTSLCVGSTETYSAPMIAGADYTWSLSSGGTPLSGTDSNSIEVEWETTVGGPHVISLEVSAAGQCFAPASTDVYLGTGGSTMSCIGHLNIGLDQDCKVEITPQRLSTVPLNPNAGFSVMLSKGGEVIPGNILTDEHVGVAIMAKLIDGCGNNSCWSTVTVVDRIAPVFTMSSDTMFVECYEDREGVLPPAEDNCNSPVTVRETYRTETLLNCDTSFLMRINAAYTAEDIYGNRSNPKPAVIMVRRPDVRSVVFPADFSVTDTTELTCGQYAIDSLSGYPALSETGVPMLGDIPLTPGGDFGLCNIGVSVETIEAGVIPGNDGCITKLMRRFIVYEAWCSNGVLLDSTQLIEIRDNEAPMITCPDNITASASSVGCTATVFLPVVTATDGCTGDAADVQIMANGALLTGQVASFPVGINRVTYITSDACGNERTCDIFVTVEDLTAPTVVCDKETVIGINSQGLGYAYASVFDDGSYDGCDVVLDSMKVRRLDGGAPCGMSSTDYLDYVEFCCADIGRTDIMVELTIWDRAGNRNSCMVSVEVQDKSVPTITCPADQTLSCTDDVTDLTIYGSASATDQCPVAVVELPAIDSTNSCGVGKIIRTWEARDSNNVATCQQVITINNTDPFVFDEDDFPEDYETDQCNRNLLLPDDLPPGFDRPVVNNTACSMADASYSDLVINNLRDSLTCYKIIRTWTIMDWCQVGDTAYMPFVADQTIKISNTIAPTITSSCDPVTTMTSANNCDDAQVSLTSTAIDDCTIPGDMQWTYQVDLGSTGDYEASDSGRGAIAQLTRDFPLGTSRVLWTWLDGCGNRTSCLQDVVVEANVPPVAACRDIIIALQAMDLDGDGVPDTEMACLPIDSIDASSFHPCGLDIDFSFSADVDNDTLKLFCSDIGVTTYEFWVTDSDGNTDVCTFEVEVQDNNNVDICREFDLALIKQLNTTATNLPVVLGDNVTFDITVCNQGGFNVGEVSLIDYIPAGFTLNDSDWTANNFGSTGNSATISLSQGSGLPVGGIPFTGDSCIVVPITLRLNNNATPANTLNYAEITAGMTVTGLTQDSDSTPDMDDTNDGGVLPGDPHDDSFETGADEDDFDVATVPLFDLALIKTTTATGPFANGQEIQFDITVTNQGNEDASSFEIVDYIPCGFELSSNNTGWVMSGTSATFTSTQVLPAAGSVTIPINLNIIPCNQVNAYLNVAEISAARDSNGDPALDIDSNADSNDGNDAGGQVNTGTDDTINNENGDEDDSDPAIIILQYCDICDALELSSIADISTSVDPGQCTATLTLPTASVVANACGENVVITNSFNNGGGNVTGTFPVGTTPVVFTVTSICGSDQEVVNVTVSDTEGPVCTNFVHPDITINNASQTASLNTGFILSQFTDLCGSVDASSLVVSQSTFDCSDVSTSAISFSVTVSDNSQPANSTTCSGTVQVIEEIAPECVVQDVTVYLDNAGFASISGNDVDGGAMDDCGFIVSTVVTPFEFDCGNIGGNTVNVTFVDNNGNESDNPCQASVTVLDTIAPVCNISDLTVNLVGNTVEVDFDDLDVNTSDNCGAFTTMPEGFVFDCANVGGNTVSITVSDASGNSTTCTAMITVVDMTTINCVTVDTVVYLPASGIVNVDASTIDGGSSAGCASTPILSVDRSFYGCNDVGTNTLTLTVSNGINSVSCPATVTVLDTIPPTVVLPDVTVECEDYDISDLDPPVVTDNCGQTSAPTTTVVVDESGLNVCGIGTLVRTFTVTDVNGNSTTATHTVTITNTDNLFTESNIIWPVADTSVTCETTTGTPYAGTPTFDFTGVDCSSISIDSTVISLNPNMCPDTIQKIWTVIDSCQLDMATGAGMFRDTQLIEVIDELPPVITGPVALGDTLFFDADPATCTADMLDLSGSVMDCSAVTVTNNSPFAIDTLSADASGDYPVGDTEVTITATDACGNQSQYEYVVSVQDTTPVSFICAKLFLDMPDTLTIPVLALDHLVVDGLDCEDPSLLAATFSPGNFNDTVYIADCDNTLLIDTTYFIWVYFDGVLIDSCKTLLTILDPNGFCPSTLTRADITGDVMTVRGAALPETYMTLEGSSEDDMTDNLGHYAFMDMPTGGAYSIVASNDTDHRNGVSTLDLILMQRHILGLSRFDKPDQYLAADINANGRITGADVVELRKFILGVRSDFPNNTSWRMLDARQQFAAPEDALDEARDFKAIPRFSSNIVANFTAVKTGDINGSVDINLRGDEGLDSRSVTWLEATSDKRDEVVLLATESKDLRGLQMSIDMGAPITSVSSDILDVEELHYSIVGSELFVSWHNLDGTPVEVGDALLEIRLADASERNVALTSSIRPEMYSGSELLIDNLSLRTDNRVSAFTVMQNVPNPWTQSTTISFIVDEVSAITFTLHDVTGRVIRQIDRTCYLGLNKIELTNNDLITGGVYYYTIDNGEQAETRKMIVLK